MTAYFDEPPHFIPSPQRPGHYIYELRNEIYKLAMSGKWTEVCDLFLENKLVRMENITRDNRTVLHVAISDATENIVLMLLKTIETTNSEDERKDILGARNISGDTPLHLAAALGRHDVCAKIAGLVPEMVTIARNDRGETPLFAAVRYGKKTAFFVLEAAIHAHAPKDDPRDWLFIRDVSHCRRSDGDNILHCAIRGENFDLAYEIIHLYPQLVNSVNSSGETALHTLANRPSAFKSGARFDLYEKILYQDANTEPLKLHFNDFKEKIAEGMHFNDSKSDILKNDSIDLFFLTKKLVDTIFKTVAAGLKTGIRKRCCSDDPESQSDVAQKEDGYGTSKIKNREDESTKNNVAFSIPKIVVNLLLFLGIGSKRLQTIGELKQKHKNAKTIMKELVEQTTLWESNDTGGMKPSDSTMDLQFDPISQHPPAIPSVEAIREAIREAICPGSQGIKEKESSNGHDIESPVLIAAKRGIREMVKYILQEIPVAIWDQDNDEKNIILLAVEHRQFGVYKLMRDVIPNTSEAFVKLDKEGNSVLHLAAMLGDKHPQSDRGAVILMRWESAWLKYVNDSIGPEIIAEVSKVNHEGKTAQQIFTETHKNLVKEGRKWLINTSQYCSVVSVLIATVAFESASTVPGGPKQDSGYPILGQTLCYQVFAISSLVALCSSVTSLVMFLSIFTSLYQITDMTELPMKLVVGLTTLALSIPASLVAFCAGDFLVVEGVIKWAAYPMYIFMCYLAISQFPLYSDLLRTIRTIRKLEPY